MHYSVAVNTLFLLPFGTKTSSHHWKLLHFHFHFLALWLYFPCCSSARVEPSFLLLSQPFTLRMAAQLGHTGWMRSLLPSFHIYHPPWGDRLDLPLDSASLTSSSALAIILSYCPHCIRYLSLSSLLSSARIGFVGLVLLWFYPLDICRHCVPDRLTPHWP